MATKGTTKKKRGHSARVPVSIMGTGNGNGGRSMKGKFDWGVAALISWLLFIWSWGLMGTDWVAHKLYWIDWQLRKFFG